MTLERLALAAALTVLAGAGVLLAAAVVIDRALQLPVTFDLHTPEDAL